MCAHVLLLDSVRLQLERWDFRSFSQQQMRRRVLLGWVAKFMENALYGKNDTTLLMNWLSSGCFFTSVSIGYAFLSGSQILHKY